MHGTPVGPASGGRPALLRKVHDAYDMNRHARTGSQQAALLDADFAARFARVRPARRAAPRACASCSRLGLERLMIVGASVGADRAQALACEARFAARGAARPADSSAAPERRARAAGRSGPPEVRRMRLGLVVFSAAAVLGGYALVNSIAAGRRSPGTAARSPRRRSGAGCPARSTSPRPRPAATS